MAKGVFRRRAPHHVYVRRPQVFSAGTQATLVGISAVNEADTAQALAVSSVVTAAIGAAEESDAAQALTVSASLASAISAAQEVDSAQALIAQQPGQFTGAQETDTAQALSVVASLTAAITAAQESDTAQPLSPVLVTSAGIGMALEIDAAQALSAIANQSATITQVESTETAQALTVVADGGTATAAEIWAYTLSNGLTAEATLVAVHTMLSELHLIHGLTAGSPLSVTAASRAAGAVSQAVAEAAGTVTVTRQ